MAVEIPSYVRVVYIDELVRELAEESVGGTENVVLDYGEDSREGRAAMNLTREQLFDRAYSDVMAEAPDNITIIGRETIKKIVYEVVDTYDYRTW